MVWNFYKGHIIHIKFISSYVSWAQQKCLLWNYLFQVASRGYFPLHKSLYHLLYNCNLESIIRCASITLFELFLCKEPNTSLKGLHIFSFWEKIISKPSQKIETLRYKCSLLLLGCSLDLIILKMSIGSMSMFLHILFKNCLRFAFHYSTHLSVAQW